MPKYHQHMEPEYAFFFNKRWIFQDPEKKEKEVKGAAEKIEKKEPGKEVLDEKKKKEMDVKKESEQKRAKLDTQVQTDRISEDVKEQAGEFKLNEMFTKGLEILKEKLKGSKNSLLSLLVVVLDQILERQKPDENGGVQDRSDLLELANNIEGSKGDPEANLKKVERDYFMLHKNNTVREFTEAVEYDKPSKDIENAIYGKNLEFDLRWNGEQIVVRHNGIANEPEVTLDQYIAVMEENPGWKAKMLFDVKDRHTIPKLQGYLERMPANFRDGIMVGTFDPEVVMQVHETLNDGRAEEARIPIVLHVFPVMRYGNVKDAQMIIKIFRNNKSRLAELAGKVITDKANSPFAAIKNAEVYTAYEDFQNTKNPEGDHVLALVNPIEEIQQKDKRIIDAILYSGGEFSFPYDPKYLNWIKENENQTGVSFKNVAVGFWNITHDDLYDALMWQDGSGKRISRISVDMESV